MSSTPATGLHHPLRRAGPRARHRPRPRQEGRARHAAADRRRHPVLGLAGRRRRGLRHRHRVRQLPALGGPHHLDGPHLDRAHDGRRPVRLPAAPRPHLPGRLAGEGRLLGRAGPARASPSSSPTSGSCSGSSATSPPRSRSPASSRPSDDPQPGPTTPNSTTRTVADVKLVFGLEFPDISEVLVWPDFFAGFNKIALINVLGVGRWPSSSSGSPAAATPWWRRPACATWPSRRSSSSKSGIVMQTIGPRGPGLDAVPADAVLLHLPQQHHRDHPDRCRCRPTPAWPARWSWPSSCGSSSSSSASSTRAPATSRTRCSRPGVPKALYILVTPIEFISTFLVRPFSLAVRLFANMLAGHILLVTFARAAPTRSSRPTPLAQADLRPAVRDAGLPHRLRGPGLRSCRPTSSRSSPPSTSAARSTPSTDPTSPPTSPPTSQAQETTTSHGSPRCDPRPGP